jgi:HK97 family phage prohead protease
MATNIADKRLRQAIERVTREMRQVTVRMALDSALGEVKAVVRERMKEEQATNWLASPEGQQTLRKRQFDAFIRGRPDWQESPLVGTKTLYGVATASSIISIHTKAVLNTAYGVGDGEQLISGYLSTYGNIDQGDDICERGCFDLTVVNLQAMQAKTGRRFLMPLLWDHNPDTPCGGIFSADTSDPIGLFITAVIDLDTSVGQLASSAVTKGYGVGLSIGYIPKKTYRDGQGIRHITQADLFEGSLTPIPMNQLATVTNV